MKRLTEHTPSSPMRPPTHSLKFIETDTRRMAIHGFCTAVAAKSFLDLVVQYTPEEKPRWKDDHTVIIGGLEIWSNKLEEILEEADSIELPYPYPSFAARIAGREERAYIPPAEEAEPPSRKRKDRAEAPRKKSPDGSTGAADIASELGLSSSVVRRILRKAGVTKPYTWTDQADIDRITELLKKG